MLQQDTQPAAAGKLLSVAVAAYNGESTLAKALDSCLTAGAERLEVLVVNDGSTDGTTRLARQYVQRRPDVFRLIDQKNGGLRQRRHGGTARPRRGGISARWTATTGLTRRRLPPC